MRTTATCSAVALTAFVISLSASPPVRPQAADPRFDQIATLITAKMTEYGIPGVAFGVLKDGQVWTRGFGVSNLDDPRPITADTIFPIASISKTFTTTAVMRLIERPLEALESEHNRPEFVLTDFSMPKLDGMCLLEVVRGKWPGIRCAIMTGNPEQSLERCDPDVPVIRKPIDPNELRRLLGEGQG